MPYGVKSGGLGLYRTSSLLRQSRESLLAGDQRAFLRIAAIDVDIGHVVERDALIF